jgi:methionyl-tRNA formyltransferase
MQMDEGLDSGDILAQVSTNILASETSESLLHRLAQLAPPLLLDTLEQLSMGQHLRQKQNELEVTHAHKITKEDAKINWQRQACEIDQQIRAYIPWPLAYATIAQQPVKIHQALVLKKAHINTPGTIVAIEKDAIHIACGKDILVIREWQWPNQKKMSLKSFLNGHQNQFALGQILQ